MGWGELKSKEYELRNRHDMQNHTLKCLACNSFVSHEKIKKDEKLSLLQYSLHIFLRMYSFLHQRNAKNGWVH